MILTVEDFSPKIRDAMDAYYIAKGDDRYQELGEEMKVLSEDLRDPVSAKVKRYLAVFVSKTEEATLRNGLNDWDLLSDTNRESTVNTGRSVRSVRISRG